MNKQMFEALNQQINKEIYSAYLYLSMSSYFASLSLPGFTHWMNLQAQEELMHAMKLFNYLVDKGEQPLMEAIDAPKTIWSSPLNVFEEALGHEQFVTKSIYELMDIAVSLKDHGTQSFLKWFIDEQTEEEATADGVVQKLKMAGDSKSGLLFLDSELAKRATAPAE